MGFINWHNLANKKSHMVNLVSVILPEKINSFILKIFPRREFFMLTNLHQAERAYMHLNNYKPEYFFEIFGINRGLLTRFYEK